MCFVNEHIQGTHTHTHTLISTQELTFSLHNSRDNLLRKIAARHKNGEQEAEGVRSAGGGREGRRVRGEQKRCFLFSRPFSLHKPEMFCSVRARAFTPRSALIGFGALDRIDGGLGKHSDKSIKSVRLIQRLSPPSSPILNSK